MEREEAEMQEAFQVSMERKRQESQERAASETASRARRNVEGSIKSASLEPINLHVSGTTKSTLSFREKIAAAKQKDAELAAKQAAEAAMTPSKRNALRRKEAAAVKARLRKETPEQKKARAEEEARKQKFEAARKKALERQASILSPFKRNPMYSFSLFVQPACRWKGKKLTFWRISSLQWNASGGKRERGRQQLSRRQKRRQKRRRQRRIRRTRTSCSFQGRHRPILGVSR